MKKIMLTTALVGSLVSAASAQTTVSGNLAIGYYATSKDNSNAQTTTAKSYNGFANESQINFLQKENLIMAWIMLLVFLGSQMVLKL